MTVSDLTPALTPTLPFPGPIWPPEHSPAPSHPVHPPLARQKGASSLRSPGTFYLTIMTAACFLSGSFVPLDKWTARDPARLRFRQQQQLVGAHVTVNRSHAAQVFSAGPRMLSSLPPSLRSAPRRAGSGCLRLRWQYEQVTQALCGRPRLHSTPCEPPGPPQGVGRSGSAEVTRPEQPRRKDPAGPAPARDSSAGSSPAKSLPGAPLSLIPFCCGYPVLEVAGSTFLSPERAGCAGFAPRIRPQFLQVSGSAQPLLFPLSLL